MEVGAAIPIYNVCDSSIKSDLPSHTHWRGIQVLRLVFNLQ